MTVEAPKFIRKERDHLAVLHERLVLIQELSTDKHYAEALEWALSVIEG